MQKCFISKKTGERGVYLITITLRNVGNINLMN